MPLHPELKAVAAMLAEAGIVPTPGGTIEQVRAYTDRVTEFVGRGSAALDDEQLVEIAGVPAKLYWPQGLEKPALFFYAHGGGFRQGTLAGWDAPMRQLVREGGIAVLSIDYALSPEHKFPLALDQIVAVMRQVTGTGSVAGRAVEGFAAGGDSAGANLILAAALTLRDAGLDVIEHLMLIYGVYSKDMSAPGWQAFEGLGLSAPAMRAVWAGYLPNDESDWRVQPLHGDLTNLPPTRLVVGTLDPLLDENKTLLAKLHKADVPASLRMLPQVNHGVIRYPEVAPVVREMLSVEAGVLHDIFAGAPQAAEGAS